MKLFNLLARAPASLCKEADVESPDQAQLESDFAGMAFMFLKDRAAGLMPFLLGFEVVDREEDGSRAVGLFGCKIGEDYYYVPAFFVNKQIKGMDLLFSKKNNSFVPLRETWINHILDKSSLSLGENVRNPTGLREDFSVPSFDFIARPPNTPKLASAGLEHLFTKDELAGKKAAFEKCKDCDKPSFLCKCEKPGKPAKGDKTAADISKDLQETWAFMQDAAKEAMHKDAGFQMAWAGAITSMKGETLDMEKAGGSPVLSYLEKHGVAATVSLLKTLGTDRSYADAALTFYPELLKDIKEARCQHPVKVAARLSVVTASDDMPKDASDAERMSLVRDGFTVIDRRPDGEKAALFDQRYEQQFSNPTEGGRYELLLPSGATAEAWILPSASGDEGLLVAINPDKKIYFNASPARVFVRGTSVAGKTAFESGSDAGSMSADGTYVLVNEKNDAVGPFRIDSIVTGKGKAARFNVYFRTWPNFSRNSANSFDDIRGAAMGGSPQSIQLLPNAVKARRAGDVLYVPATWKAVKLDDANECGCCCCPSVSDSAKETGTTEEKFAPGDLLFLQDELYKTSVHKLVVETDGVAYSVILDQALLGPMSYKQAMVTLVTKLGTSVPDAELLVKEANSDFKARRMIKLSQGVGVGIQMPIDPGVYGVDDGTGVSVQPPFEGYTRGQFLGVGQRQDPLQPGFAVGGQSQREVEGGNSGGGAMGGYAPGGEPLGAAPDGGQGFPTGGAPMGQDIASLSQQALQSGQKQVFDHSTIGGLAKMYDAGAAIDMYLPDMMKALDRIGRILFIFYWKNEDFAERYGEEELATMEDLIRGVFKSFGDLVLKLKEKSVSGSDSKEVMAI